VAGDLDALPGRQMIEDILNSFLEFFLRALNFAGEIDAVMVDLAKLVDLFFHVHDRPLESEARVKNIARPELDLLPDRDRLHIFLGSGFLLFDLLGHE
jgi:hypothetical protein